MPKLWGNGQETIVGVKQYSVPPQVIYLTIYLRVLLHELRPPPRQRMVTSEWAEESRAQTGWNQKAADGNSWNINLLPHHQTVNLLPQPPTCYLTTKHKVKDPAALPLNFAYKRFFPQNHWGVLDFWALATPSCSFFAIKFLSSRLQHFGLFGLTVHWAHKVGFKNSYCAIN